MTSIKTQPKQVFTPNKEGNIAISFGVVSEKRMNELHKKMDGIRSHEVKNMDNEVLCRIIERYANEVGETPAERNYAIFQSGAVIEELREQNENPMMKTLSSLGIHN